MRIIQRKSTIIVHIFYGYEKKNKNFTSTFKYLILT